MASRAPTVVLFAIQLLLLTFAIIGSGLLVRPAAAETAAGGRVDIGVPGSISVGGSVTTPPSPVVSGPPHGAEVIGRGH
ncbi:hypothetical protein OsI_23492 [Oryza sativa Indica Group]|uniref:Uncharacterized protein n=2 Tax=Oryza TaxID=4527 RepID=A0A0E0ISP4_ORYNI|nr:hypothetical protein OsI_23492 [Oryza sativa Indica Group]